MLKVRQAFADGECRKRKSKLLLDNYSKLTNNKTILVANKFKDYFKKINRPMMITTFGA